MIAPDGHCVTVCACGEPIPTAFAGDGQATGSKLCDACRERRVRRHPDYLLEESRDLPRCLDCTAVVGLRWGTATHLDADGRCPSCVGRHAEPLAGASREQRGRRFAVGMGLRRPASRSRAAHPRRYHS
jgi:hypothetical protein